MPALDRALYATLMEVNAVAAPHGWTLALPTAGTCRLQRTADSAFDTDDEVERHVWAVAHNAPRRARMVYWSVCVMAVRLIERTDPDYHARLAAADGSPHSAAAPVG